jgi:hypothetical protein
LVEKAAFCTEDDIEQGLIHLPAHQALRRLHRVAEDGKLVVETAAHPWIL